MIECAVLMCGGKATRFNSLDKSLESYNGRTMISYVLEALSEAKISQIIVIANKKNYLKLEKEINKYFINYTLITEPPLKFREFIKVILPYIGDKEFLLIVGNQPMPKDFIKRLIAVSESGNNWAVTLYSKSSSTEKSLVSLSKDGFIKKGNEFVIQHPFIISKELLNYQEKENFDNKIETTITNLIEIKDIKGIKSEMPPEFDNFNMLKNTHKYITKTETRTLFLPGNNLANKSWMSKIKDELNELFYSSIEHHYSHWTSNKEIIDLDHELMNIKEKFEEQKTNLIIAKSAGILLALKAIKDNLLQPDKCVFIGFPLNWALRNKFNILELIENYNIPTLFIQNDLDPFCNILELREFLKQNNFLKYTLNSLKGNTHDYDNLSEIKESITNYLGL